MKHSRSSLFLMELIIALLFFSLASTVCIQLFARSHLLSRQTVNQNHAVIQAENLAEMFLAVDGDVAQMKALLPKSANNTTGDNILLWFDSDWVECNQSDACYFASLTPSSGQEGMVEADIAVSSIDSDEKPFYELHIVHHVAERRGNLEQD